MKLNNEMVGKLLPTIFNLKILKKMIKNIIESYKHIPYTFKHYIAFMKLQKKLLGYYKYKFHDLDKIFMYVFMPFLGTKKIKNIHRKKMHHIEKHKNVQDCNYEEAIIDWECARFTKPDKPETARQVTERKFHQQPKHYTHLILMLNRFKL